jgi:hypothetical protein
VASKRQRQHQHQRRRLASRPRPRACLYCRTSEAEFVGEEHVVPFALGNRKEVLPAGVVCRPCNNGPLSRLDQALVSFEPIAFMRVHLNLPGREGRVPPARFANAHISRGDEVDLVIDCKTNKPAMTLKPGKRNEFQLNLTGRRMTKELGRTLTRALYKSLLGFIYLDHGRHFAMRERFDEARAMILGQAGAFHGYLAMPKTSKPTGAARFTYQFIELDGVPTVGIFADYFGVQFISDLDARRVFDRSKARRDLASLIEF